ncbi:MAG: hypothetical protein HYZ14_00030 [Bacteroidetes bacterium]|nr:hypothetical protein [Bacteroidota bacterium]
MKVVLSFFVCLVLLSCNRPVDDTCEACDLTDSIPADSTTAELNAYDSLYAQKLGADEYGMKTYVMAFLKDGPNNDLDSAEAAQLQMEHMANINRMAEEGKLVLAGPFYSKEGSDLRGIYVFNVETIEEAEELTKSDPAVQAGSLTMDLQMWYGSAALMEVNAIHKRVAKENH